jgi:hypothetical protein
MEINEENPPEVARVVAHLFRHEAGNRAINH